MKKMKGIGLLLLANILIFITLSITFTILSEMVLPAFGIDIRGSIVHYDLLWAFVLDSAEPSPAWPFPNKWHE